MKNITKAIFACGFLLSITGCSEEMMSCIEDSSASQQIYGIDRGGSPVTINGIDRGGSPISINGIDRGGSPITVNGIDRGGSPSAQSIDTTNLDSSILECIQNTNVISTNGIDRGGRKKT